MISLPEIDKSIVTQLIIKSIAILHKAERNFFLFFLLPQLHNAAIRSIIMAIRKRKIGGMYE